VTDRGEAGERAVEHVAGRTSADVRDETDATGIALASRVVEKALLVAHRAAFPVVRTDLPPVFLGLVRRGGRGSAD
jgi:hypothetical protein